jgi:hypothetical protein
MSLHAAPSNESLTPPHFRVAEFQLLVHPKVQRIELLSDMKKITLKKINPILNSPKHCMVLEIREYALYKPPSISWHKIPPKRQQIFIITHGVMSKNTKMFTNIAAKTPQICQKTRLI